MTTGQSTDRPGRGAAHKPFSKDLPAPQSNRGQPAGDKDGSSSGSGAGAGGGGAAEDYDSDPQAGGGSFTMQKPRNAARRGADEPSGAGHWRLPIISGQLLGYRSINARQTRKLPRQVWVRCASYRPVLAACECQVNTAFGLSWLRLFLSALLRLPVRDGRIRVRREGAANGETIARPAGPLAETLLAY